MGMGMTEIDGPTLAELRTSADSLLASWDALTSHDIKVKTQARDVTIIGYALHAHSLAHAYLSLIDRGFWQQGFPTLRACYELAVTAQWTFTIPNAVKSSLREAERQRKNFIDSVIKAGMLEGDDLQTRLVEAEEASKLFEEAKDLPTRFEGICNDLSESAFLYMVYRSLSQLTHAGAGIPNLYAVLDQNEQLKSFAPQELGESHKRLCLHQLCTSLVWAGRAADGLAGLRERRSQLRQVATQLGMPDHLTLGASAFNRAARGKHRKESKACQGQAITRRFLQGGT